METQVLTPQKVFFLPQRLVVPLFQRPYVWNQESQWEPLWDDVTRVAERVLKRPSERHHAHFLGAVVLQQVQKPAGLMQERTIIDGQQRLTTLQLLLDALHAELQSVKALAPALRIEPLVENAAPFCSRPEDRFKVWPTNRDRPAFNAVMGAKPPVSYDAVDFPGERMVQAHQFFSESARDWLDQTGEEQIAIRAAAIETTVRELLQLVVIDLAPDENAQEIFETLNARGAQLTAADLIKNFIFQRLLETGSNVEEAYQARWKDFETGFWEAEVSVGRLRYPRSSVFFNHWLTARTGEEVVAREVFDRFKRFADHDSNVPMSDLLRQVHGSSQVYKQFIAKSETYNGTIDQLGLFGYRTSVQESEVVKPLILSLLDPDQEEIPYAQIQKVLHVVEGWMVRRMLVRATTKNYNQVIADLIAQIKGDNRRRAGDVIEEFLAKQSSGSRYWPDDNELREELTVLLAYKRLRRGRLRMVLEAIEDHLRGWKDGQQALGGERVARGQFVIEHVMPRKWQSRWPLENGVQEDSERDALVHTLGNLTLLTGRLNSKVSNGPWIGDEGKSHAIKGHDVLFLNRRILNIAGRCGQWNDDAIRQRTQQLIETIIEIWPVPLGHRSGFSGEHIMHRRKKKIKLADLISAGVLSAGMPLFPRKKKHNDKVATLLSDGRLEIDGVVYESPSPAARNIVGHQMNGWWFFLVDQASRRSLRMVRRDYINSMAVETEDDEPDEEEDDEE
ncbi:GmrSD restriction endonuclease domain-containing protein [Nitrospira sp. Nam80]